MALEQCYCRVPLDERACSTITSPMSLFQWGLLFLISDSNSSGRTNALGFRVLVLLIRQYYLVGSLSNVLLMILRTTNISVLIITNDQ